VFPEVTRRDREGEVMTGAGWCLDEDGPRVGQTGLVATAAARRGRGEVA
jgi:hypothetical protein